MVIFAIIAESSIAYICITYGKLQNIKVPLKIVLNRFTKVKIKKKNNRLHFLFDFRHLLAYNKY